MPFDIITRLRESSPEDRVAIIQATYDKNRQYFQEKHPALHGFLENTTCPYRIDLTSKFLNIVHDQTHELAHPQEGLDHYAEMLGGWVHEAWQDLFNFEVIGPLGHEKHLELIRSFDLQMGRFFPQRQKLFECGNVNLKPIDSDRRFAPPVVFLGVFHGLHIAHFLKQTDLTEALFIEPDPERFEVSCYLLDYEAIEARFGLLRLHIGQDIQGDICRDFFAYNKITTHMWIRVLPGYVCDATPHIIEELNVMLHHTSDLIFSLDRHIVGLKNALNNIKKNRLILSHRPKLSEKCQIAIVATGPSLDNDIRWLKKNKERVIVFAVHSAVRSLRKHGITPDFQFSIETDMPLETIRSLQFYKDVPLIAYYKTGEEVLSAIDFLLLCGEKNNANLIDLACPLEHTHPSTANLAFSFACWCQPEAIYLLGCDFGYRSHLQHHAHASLPAGRKEQQPDKTQMFVPANFPENGPVKTESFFNQARVSMEKMIRSEQAQGIKVYNFADGAQITGAEAKKSAQLKEISQYSQRTKDCQTISMAFQPAVRGENYQLYPLAGGEILDGFKKIFLETLDLEKFSWPAFFRALDTAIGQALYGMGQAQGGDYRMEMYVKVLHDVLAAWYLYIIFFDNKEDGEQVYREGYRLLTEIVSSVEWPAELDEIYGSMF